MNDKNTNNNSILTNVVTFLDSVTLSRSANTVRTYRNGMNKFLETLTRNECDPEKEDITSLNEDSIIWFTPRSERFFGHHRAFIFNSSFSIL